MSPQPESYLCKNFFILDNSITREALLVLEDGSTFRGSAIGKIGTTTGEICFNTGMTGYQEIFTDPSYFGQIIVMTGDHIGNYGVSSDETESVEIRINGLICKKFSPTYSRKMASGSLNDYFVDNNLVGISEVDTREIVRHIRSKGAMNCIISSEILEEEKLLEMVKKVPSMQGLELSSKVSVREPYFFGNENAALKVAVLDLGVKTNILRCLEERDCYMKVFPGNTTYEEMKAWNPDGYMLSNGPGDPSAMSYAVDTVKQMVDHNEVVFGICLGCQIMAESAGMTTFKMHNGHRGLNHPVTNMVTGRSEITSQNHGFAIDANSADTEVVEITHMNLNDNTVEGIRLKGKDAFSVQYHPESSPGPHDSRYLFDDFIALMKKRK